MKSSKNLLLTTIMTVGVVSVANAATLPASTEPYVTGTDAKGRTSLHMLAKYISATEDARVNEFVNKLKADAPVLSQEDLKKLALVVDSKGRTALAIAQQQFEKTGHKNCAELAQQLEGLMSAPADASSVPATPAEVVEVPAASN